MSLKTSRGRIRDYLSLVKFSHTVFAMPFALLGYFTAVKGDNCGFSGRILILVLLCMVFARNAAMGFNRYADKKIDSINPRTSGREIPAGIISPRSALWFVIVNSILFITAAAMINRLAFFLSPVALALILGYSLTKRFTSLSHLFLGLSLSLSPVGAYIAVSGKFAAVPVIYGLVVLTWVSGFDIIYSLQDARFDRQNRLHSIPAAFGERRALGISTMLHLLSLLSVIAAGILSEAGIIYYAGAVIFSTILISEHIIIRPGKTDRIDLAFATFNSMAGIIFSALAIISLYF
ncbi:MAG: putative 4-hydroxybenzoate polyprenyltransferase [Bacteroidales bacterium]|nr:putative 4-hydroxybenzoate polyprenyltransferase [Bacteroidales bacterium]